MQRRELLDRYFPFDLVPFEELVDNQWNLVVFLRDYKKHFADPRMEVALERWFEKISFEELGLYCRFFKNGMLSFHDSWSLYYWSLVVQWLRSQGMAVDKISLFHVDDHADLGSPLLERNGEAYRCMFTQKETNFNDPRSVREAIIQKSVDIGSFICPLLHEIDEVDIFHLKYSQQGEFKRQTLGCTHHSDTLLVKGKQRPALELDASYGKHSYTLASSPFKLLDEARHSSLLFLHIDCDGFNNRYNGDSSWNKRSSSIDLDLKQIKGRITELLEQVSLLPAKVFTNVALSPDFFPSEYWREVTSHLFSTADKLNIIQDDGFSAYLKEHAPHEYFNEKFS